jgi:hypothetical protein
MEGRTSFHSIDQTILRILSLYERLNLLDLWYEIGEDDRQKERVTKEEVLSRLEALTAQGFVERFTVEEGDIRWALKSRMDLEAG